MTHARSSLVIGFLSLVTICTIAAPLVAFGQSTNFYWGSLCSTLSSTCSQELSLNAQAQTMMTNAGYFQTLGTPQVCIVRDQICGTSSSSSSMCICTQEYNPVCGTNGQTYSNSCYAGCANVAVQYYGVCGYSSSYSTSSSVNTNDCQTYDPVCGNDNHDYWNTCEANKYGNGVKFRGYCSNNGSSSSCWWFFCTSSSSSYSSSFSSVSGDCVTYAPVCGTNGHDYWNACQAAKDGVGVARTGSCNNNYCQLWPFCSSSSYSSSSSSTQCICPLNYSPVCGTNNITYSNTCFAGCAGVGVAYNGVCGMSSSSSSFCPVPDPPGNPPNGCYYDCNSLNWRGCRYCSLHCGVSSSSVCPVIDYAVPPAGCSYICTKNWRNCNTCTLQCNGTQNCASRGSCKYSGQCPAGTYCSGLPAFGCYPANCPVPL